MKSSHQLNFGFNFLSHSCAFQLISEQKFKMVTIKFLFVIFVVFCESKKSLVPQAILQLVRSNYGERPVVIEIFYNSKKIEILDETLKLLGEKNHQSTRTRLI